MIRRIKNWWNSRKRRRHLAAIKPVLREFVYLDEVSVTSLLSSRLGALPEQYTETLSKSIKSEVNSSINADAKVLKSAVGSRFETTQSNDSQVVRKATIQATFKDLHEYELNNSSMIREDQAEGAPPTWEKVAAEIYNQSSAGLAQSWALSNKRLARGELIELKVRLRADPTYRVSSIISTMADLLSNQHLAAAVDPEDMEQAQAFNEILESLMAGLVPLKCEVVDYSTFTVDGHDFAIHRKMEAGLSESILATRRPLYLAGVTEQSLYWKDIRRVLFSDAPVWVLGRIAITGIQSRWAPVKLAEVLKEVLPDFGEEIDRFSSGALNALAEDTSPEDSVEQRVRVLALYAELVAGRCSMPLDEEARNEIDLLARQNSEYLASFTESRRAFSLIVSALEDRFVETVPPEVAVQERSRAWHLSGVTPGDVAPSRPEGSMNPGTDERFLDCEFVAIYW
ncbi:hypothetical protein R2B67_27285 [Streptomyces cyaneofuscatus]|uniref:DUF6414 family protein n=1 Tax=Streptomyces cyaneofuscatus TaxID=66883 RepID=UPI002953DE0A|nr:hypothetical protein [Streptomyces cyaneofuscatus]WOP12018.1 hypothetical protein R2B67_27285 [Streptomyces cyaneofuscatus]